MIIAELSVVPVGTETSSVSKYVAAAFSELKKMGLKPKLNSMCTEFEARNLKTALKALERAHNAALRMGAKRVLTTLKIDDRKDKKASMKKKIASVKKWQRKMKRA